MPTQQPFPHSFLLAELQLCSPPSMWLKECPILMSFLGHIVNGLRQSLWSHSLCLDVSIWCDLDKDVWGGTYYRLWVKSFFTLFFLNWSTGNFFTLKKTRKDSPSSNSLLCYIRIHFQLLLLPLCNLEGKANLPVIAE